MVTSPPAEIRAPGAPATDLGPLAWVLDETRKSIESAAKSLRRFAHDSEGAVGVDLASVDASQLRMARQQLHQVVGALEMVGQSVPAQMVRGMEGAVQRFVLRPEKCTEGSAQVLERAGFALVEYLQSQLGQRPRSALGLFPHFRQVQEMAGADRIHPADLWDVSWRWLDPATPAAPQPLPYSADVRNRLDQRVLKVMKYADVNAASEIGLISLGLAQGEAARQPAVFWKLAAGFFEALAKALVPMDVYAKRTASRILLQYSSLARGDQSVSERLAQDVLFFCAQAVPAPAASAPVLAAVRQAWALDRLPAGRYDQPTFGLYDPAVLALARRRIDALKESWSALAGGDLARMKACVDQFSLVAESLGKLHEQGQPLADALNRVAQHMAHHGKPPGAELAMETATAVLFLEASFADFQPGEAIFAARTQQLAERLDAVREGAVAPALESWMEQLYRSVSDRQTMGTVVGELRATLSEVEQHLDQFFRQPDNHAPLEPVPGLMGQMRGVLSVLGLDQAALAVGRMRDAVDGFLAADPGAAPAQASGTFERLGNSLGALGFQIDMLGYQPMLARKLFVYDADSGELKHVAGRVSAPLAPPDSDPAGIDGAPDMELDFDPEAPAPGALDGDAAPAVDMPDRLAQMADRAALDDKPALARAAQRAAEAARERDEVALTGALQALQAVASPPAPATAPAEDESLQEDDLLDIFLEEAHEVLHTGREALHELARAPADLALQTTLRRAFHTLKGSSRMVGLAQFGEAAWSMEQLLNAWLAEQRPVTEELRTVAGEALQGLGDWVEDIAARNDTGWSSRPFSLTADALRLAGRRLPIDLRPQDAGHPSSQDAAPIDGLPPVTMDESVPEAGHSLPAAGAGHAVPVLDPLSLTAFELPDLELAPAGEAAATPAFDATEPAALAVEMVEFDLSDGVTDTLADADPSVEVVTLDAHTLGDGLDGPTQANDFLDGGVQVLEIEALPMDRSPDTGVSALDDDFSFTATSADAAPTRPGQLLALELPELDFLTQDAGAAGDADPGSDGAPAQGQDEAVLAADAEARADTDAYRQIGDLRISTPLYNVYLNEADEWSRQLSTELSEWALELEQPVPERAIARAHSLAGSSATVGFTALSELARAVEHALQRLHGQPHGTPEQAAVLGEAAEDIRRVLHQFAAGMLKLPSAPLLAAVQALEPADSAEPIDAAQPSAPVHPPAGLAPASADIGPPPDMPMATGLSAAAVLDTPSAPRSIADNIDVVDVIDPDLFPIFEEEAAELLPQLGAALRQWLAHPDDRNARAQVLRALHTLKGSARLAGALRLGEMAHRTESEIESIGIEHVGTQDLEPLLDNLDELQAGLRRLQPAGDTESLAPAAPAAQTPAPSVPDAPAQADLPTPHAAAAPPGAPGAAIAPPTPLSLTSVRAAASQAVRVRSQLLDRLVTQAGEVVTSRARLETEVGQLRGSLNDLTGNLERLRLQLRDVELQAETQMQSRLASTQDAQQSFDPLEFDRFTRMQELTRMMAESVNDVATVQRSLQRAIEASEDDLAAQARQSRDLQRDLLRTRMVEFDGIVERLYRVVRQASKETGKQVRLDIVGGAIEMDRGILERMVPAFEHLLRNCVVHGIETQIVRAARGKDVTGLVSIEVQQAGNDVSVEFRDDGGGLDLARIRAQAQRQGLIPPGQSWSDAEVANLVFAPGFTTVGEVTELAGRGVGMDVVRTEVQALGGRIQTQTQEGQGASFRLVLPLTTAVTHVVMLRIGQLVVGVPSNLVEIVRRATADELRLAYEHGSYGAGDASVSFFWSGALLQHSPRSAEPARRTTPVVIFRSADQRVAVHVDEVLGNQEVVVKSLGPQLSRLSGLVAITALASGAVALIYNPVALAAVYGEQARALGSQALPQAAAQVPGAPPQPAQSDIPLVLVVDDSITVRRVTQRLLQREGYRVALAADGLQGLERLQGERPAVVLSDIEMPRMDGFDFVRNIRADDRLHDLPVIMITSRIAEKHREHARQLGVNHYLGKPYSEDELLGLIKDYVRAAAASGAA